ncbi:MAG: hypothetical protein ACI4I1_00320 [Oscillospiraceae bacterium]
MMKKISGLLLSATVIAYAAALLYFNKAVSEGVIASVKVCINVIIPSLFPFMVASGIIVSSDLYYKMSAPFSLLSRYVFRIRADLFSVFLISSVGGYPVGAKLLTNLYESGKIDRRTAEKMLSFCYMGGPAFFIGAAGMKIYGSTATGMIIFASIIISNTAAMLLSGLRSPIPPKEIQKKTLNFNLDGFVTSINSGGCGIAKICAAILFFASILAVLEASGILDFLAVFISKLTHISPDVCKIFLRSILEISNISDIPSDISFMPVVTALLSFGGLCVIIQVEGIIGGKLSTNNFLICRIVTMILSYFCCKILILTLDVSNYIQVSSISGDIVQRNSPIPSLFLLIMTILLLSKNFIEKNKKI